MQSMLVEEPTTLLTETARQISGSKGEMDPEAVAYREDLKASKTKTRYFRKTYT